MIRKKYQFTPKDIMTYFIIDDSTVKGQTLVLRDLFENYNTSIILPFRKDYLTLKKAVSDLLIINDICDEDLNEAEIIMSDIGNEINYEDDYFASYFKLIKLQLMYSDINYRKIKLRNLIKDFGYQRRTMELIENINECLKSLKLETYLRNYERCDIWDVNLDYMVMIRLKE